MVMLFPATHVCSFRMLSKMLSASSSFSKEALSPGVPVLNTGISCERVMCTNFEIFWLLIMKLTVQNIRNSYAAVYLHHFIKTKCGNISSHLSERIVVIFLVRFSERQKFWPGRYSCPDVSVSRCEQLNNTLSFSILRPIVVSLFVGIEAVLHSFIEVTVVTYRDLYSYYYD